MEILELKNSLGLESIFEMIAERVSELEYRSIEMI